MFQSFEDRSDPSQGPSRLAALRAKLAANSLDGFLVPRADRHQGENVAPCDDRLSWLTGFTGSAGFAVVLKDVAGVFIDCRYTLQVRDQIDLGVFSPVAWPSTSLGAWLGDQGKYGEQIGFDAWLHTKFEIDAARATLESTDIKLVACDNLIDQIWADRPAPPVETAVSYPDELAGQTSAQKREKLGAELRAAGHRAAVLTLPESIAWALNIRGGDIERVPIVQAFAVLHDDGRVALYSDPKKFDGLIVEATVAPWDNFAAVLRALKGPVRVDAKTAPWAVWDILEAAGIESVDAVDPCLLPKACKTAAEIAGSRAAQLRDAAAMVEFLSWLDAEAPKGWLTEIDVVKKLEGYRRATNVLRDISFETISGAGPNGAINHYRVTEATNMAVKPGELLLVDSGGQYIDGTTDITRTIAIGSAGAQERRAFTLVLKGVIAVSKARWPKGLAGRDLDALARNALWQAGLDYDHGTGHGVGAYLSVHEGPQRISRTSHEPLRAGMILSNEPGYYREGVFGIRIENLIVVQAAPDLPDGDNRQMLDFETLTWVPIDRNLINAALLTEDERTWVNDYHARVAQKLHNLLSDDAAKWMAGATAPI